MAAMSLAVMGLGLAAGAETSAVAPIDYRMPAEPAREDGCRRAGDEEIVVCGRRGESRYRLGGGAPAPQGMVLTRRSPFDWDLGGGARGYVDLDQVQRPDGYIDRRVMITVRIPF